MDNEWDPAEDRANFLKHEISFADAVAVFEDPFVIEEDSSRPEYGEERRKAIGMLDGFVITVVFTYRAGNRRIISARRARRDERHRYRQGSASG